MPDRVLKREEMRNNGAMIRLRLQELMDERGWKQEDLAAASGVEQGTISKIMSGRRRWHSGHLEQFAKGFDVDFTELFDDRTDGRVFFLIRRVIEELPDEYRGDVLETALKILSERPERARPIDNRTHRPHRR
jgi:transcriptional regulator with XRE-family HTH domain